MRVVVDRQAEMSCPAIVAGTREHVFTGPHQFDHGERQVWKVVRILSGTRHEEFVQRFRIGGWRQMTAETLGERHDPIPPRWRSHNPLNERQLPILEEPRDHLIGRDHEVFNQRGRAVLLLGLQADDLLIPHDRPALNRLDVEGTVTMSRISQRAGSAVLKRELRLKLRRRLNLGRWGGRSIEPADQRRRM